MEGGRREGGRRRRRGIGARVVELCGLVGGGDNEAGAVVGEGHVGASALEVWLVHAARAGRAHLLGVGAVL